MRRVVFGLLIWLLLGLLTLVGVWLLGAGLPGGQGPSAADLRPAPTPDDGRQIAVLQLRVVSDAAGEVIGVEMQQGEQRPGYGPNVVNRPGPWTVLLTSGASEALRYGIQDPRLARVESDDPSAPHGTLLDPDVTFELVVPLATAEGEPLAVDIIRLYDRDGRLIFAAGLRDRELVPLPVRQLE